MIRPNISTFAQADIVLITARLLSANPPFSWVHVTTPDSLESLTRAAGVDADIELELLQALTAACDAVARISPHQWGHERTRLFEAGVQCPINETGYIRRDKGAIIADICGFYRAFGVEPKDSSGEKADHLVCELEFLAALLVMLAKAEAARESERIEVVTAAIRGFSSDHLGEWIGLFCHRLVATAEVEMFDATADVLRCVWDLLARRFDLPAFTDLDREPGEPSEPGTPYECDMAETTCPLQALSDAKKQEDVGEDHVADD